MIDLHSHSLFSDGVLIPAEHVRRVEAMGYEAIAITDHADSSNIDFILPRLIAVAKDLNGYLATRLIPGLELTHVPPGQIKELTERARMLGAQLVLVHGETIVEPVAQGTNRAAIDAGVDILAHPGFITEEEARMAATKGIFLEISGRKGHSLTNGHVVKIAQKTGAKLVLNADAHGPGDFLTAEMAEMIGRGAGLSSEEYLALRSNMKAIIAALPRL